MYQAAQIEKKYYKVEQIEKGLLPRNTDQVVVGGYIPVVDSGGGDPGNLWDIQPDYDDDGVHLNELGYTAAANKINSTIKT